MPHAHTRLNHKDKKIANLHVIRDATRHCRHVEKVSQNYDVTKKNVSQMTPFVWNSKEALVYFLRKTA